MATKPIDEKPKLRKIGHRLLDALGFAGMANFAAVMTLAAGAHQIEHGFELSAWSFYVGGGAVSLYYAARAVSAAFGQDVR